MRMTFDLPDGLLDEAMEATGSQTKTRVIITALEEIVRKARISGLKKFKGKVDLEMDLQSLRRR